MHEYIHPSVMHQPVQLPQLELNLKANPALICSLAPLEEKFKDWWPYVPGVNQPPDERRVDDTWLSSVIHKLVSST